MLRSVALSLTSMSLVLASTTAWSQEASTREEADRQRREEKAQELRPYEPNRLERWMDFAEDKAIFILDREGFHPKLGSLTTGSGFAYGLGFRDRDLFSNTGALELWAAGIRGGMGSVTMRASGRSCVASGCRRLATDGR
jgi:hypothetical protein